MDTSHIKSEETLKKFGYLPSHLTKGSERRVIFECEFCHRNFESSFKSINRSCHIACSHCRSIAAAYTITKSTRDKYEFWKVRQLRIRPETVDDEGTLQKYGYKLINLGPGSARRVVANCEFCLSKFDTKVHILNNKPEVIACKKCDAIAAIYSRLNSTEDKHQFYLVRRPNFSTDCLDIEATKKKFGYSPLDLSSYSANKIVVICKYCNTRLEIRMSKFSIRRGRITCWSCMRKKTVETLEQRYGVRCTLDIPAVRKKLADPKTEQIVETVLKERYKIEYIRGYSIGPYSFDFFLPEINLLIECQGDYFHDFKKFGYFGTPKDRAKSSYVENNTNHKLVWIWEHEIHLGRIRKILDYHIYNSIESAVNPILQSIEFKSISNQEAHAFLSQYHYLGNLGTVATSFGAFYENMLVVVCAFGGVTRNQSIKKVNKLFSSSFGPKQVRELRRFCIRPNVNTKNLASFCIKKFVDFFRSINPGIQAIISFSDPTVGDIGTIYKASNWQEMSRTTPSYHYMDPQTSRIIHKKTVWSMAKSAHMREKDFVALSGLFRVEELPKSAWVKIF